MLLYKYYPPTLYSLDALISEYLWFSKNENLNDPFDLVGFQSKRTNNDFERLLKRCQDYDIWPKGMDISDVVVEAKKYALCSFSRTSTNLLMWAYYASSYAGWCMGFNSDMQICKNQYLQPHEAIYVDSPYNVNEDYVKNQSYGRTNLEKTLNLLLRIKSDDWSHEQEYRMLVKTNCQNGVRQFLNSKSIMSIILGNKMSKEYENIVQSIIKQKNKIRLQNHELPIIMYRITKNINTFSLHTINIG